MSPFVSPSGGASLPPSVGHSGSPAAPPPSTSASAPVSVPSAGPSVPAGVLGVSPDRSPAETCDDTLRRLEHVLSDALARIAPNAHPATPIRFFNYLDGTVRANVVFDGGGTLIVALSPLWADEFRMWMVYNVLSMGSDGTYWLSYAIGIPRRGVVVADPAASPLTADQLRALADEPGLTLTP
jgi:hypothetical protein